MDLGLCPEFVLIHNETHTCKSEKNKSHHLSFHTWKVLRAVKGVSEPYAPNSGISLALISCKFSFTNVQFEEQQYNPEEIRGCSPSIQKHWHYCHNLIFAKPSLVHLEVVEQEIK